jgi:hypothetical protein
MLKSGESVNVTNGSAYEIYRKPSSALAIRRISP